MDEPDDSGSPVTASSNKRKSSEQDHPQKRAKRNRYISIACNECKRRKIKCNGQTPCQRCGNLNLECVYAPNCCNNFKDSEEFQQMTSHIADLQSQVQALFNNMAALKSQVEPQTGSMDMSPPSAFRRSISVSTPTSQPQPPKPTRFHGPTSAVFNLGVAKSSLTKNFGITGIDDNTDDARLANGASPAGTPPPLHTIPSQPPVESIDVLWTITKEEALRLVNIQRDHIHIMYPVFDLDKLIKYVDQVYSFIESSKRSGLIIGELPGSNAISDDETTTLRLVLANGAEQESSGDSEFGLLLFKEVVPVIESYMMRPPELKHLEHLVLASLFYFNRGDEGLAWRLNGVAARMCFELGLHQQETFESGLQNNMDRYRACVLFWSIYVLDRRWSFSTGLPFSIQDHELDPALLKPSSPYLSNMVVLTAMSSKIWPRMNSPKNVGLDVSELEYLDIQVVRWQQSLPGELSYTHSEQDNLDEQSTRLRVLLYLRANQVRILIGRQVLLSTSTIMDNLNYANTVVGVIKDTIHVLSRLHQTTERYRKFQAFYNYFLISALAALFLAVAHAPAQYAASCRDEFYLALDIVRNLSSSSFLAKRLWKTIRVLKEIGPQIGLAIRNNTTPTQLVSTPEDAHSSAAVAMANLAGHPMDSLPTYAQHPQQPPPGADPAAMQSWENWNVMADDLTNLFEAAGNRPAYTPSPAQTVNADGRELTWLFGQPQQQDGFSRAFKDLF